MNMTAPNIGDPSLSQTDRLKTEGTGILVLVSPLRIVYANAAARVVTSHLKQLMFDEKPGPGLPDEILDFCEKVMSLLEDQESDHRAQTQPFELCREIHVASERILLRGIGLPRPEGGVDSRACILMDIVRPGVDRSDGPLRRSTCYA